ncbi:MAG: HEAT repeat domain-containing protein [Planctomycetes bacterium]|nr:HEAT repeat domain-containing protein [Planctomycetota bacterium]
MTHPGRGRPGSTTPPRWIARIAPVLLCLAPCASAQADSEVVARLVAADAARLLLHRDPVVRGEAALVLAARSDPANHVAIVAVAADDDPAARLRGLLALGLQASPGVASLLADELLDHGERTRPAGLAAAYALGSLPPDHAPAIVTETLTSFLQASWRRQRDVLAALLLGMRRHAQAPQTTALRRLFDEESNRDPDLRAALLGLLLPIDPTFDAPRLRRVLERGSEAERLALVHWLAVNPSPGETDLLPAVARLAVHGTRPELRARALEALTRLRHLPALEFAARALRSTDPGEVGQAVQSALRIGGTSMRGALERHLLAEPDPRLQAAMLRAWSAPPSPALADACAEFARRSTPDPALRCAAVLLLARCDAPRAAPMLRDAFRQVNDSGQLELLARALVREPASAPPLARLLDGAADLHGRPAAWRALLGAGHPEAVRQLLACLRDPGADARDLAAALRAWREVTTPLTPQLVARFPAALRRAIDAD